MKNSVVNDADRLAYLLQLDLHEKMTPTTNNNLINCHISYGPLFGGGTDFGMQDNCHKLRSYGNFPTSYNREGPVPYYKNPETYKAFTGSSNGNVRYV